jgi:hypothetical protein
MFLLHTGKQNVGFCLRLPDGDAGPEAGDSRGAQLSGIGWPGAGLLDDDAVNTPFKR